MASCSRRSAQTLGCSSGIWTPSSCTEAWCALRMLPLWPRAKCPPAQIAAAIRSRLLSHALARPCCGQGTTVEALRMRKPVAVTGILLMDQRFWGLVCNEKGVGPMPCHIEPFKEIAVDWADRALDPESDYSKAAAALTFGDEANDGVSANVQEFARIADADLDPPKSSELKELGDLEATSSIPKNA